MKLRTLISFFLIVGFDVWVSAGGNAHPIYQNLFHTRSIVACDPGTSECGIAVVSYPMVSAVVVGRPGVMVANQSTPSIATARAIITSIGKGSDAETALNSAVANDPGKAFRQFGVAALSNTSPSGVTVANFTGKKNTPETCSLLGSTFAVQANLQTSSEVCQAMATGFASTHGSLPMRLLAALKAGTPVSHTNLGGDFSASVRVYSNKWVLKDITEVSADANVDRSANWEQNLEFNLTAFLAIITPGSPEDLVELTASRSQKILTAFKALGYYKGNVSASWNSETEKALQDFASINLFFPRATTQNNGKILIDGPLASYITNGFARKVLVPNP